MKILIVEDDSFTLQAIEIKLTNEGYETLCYSNAIEAIDGFKLLKPDLVITDILMPHTSGLELIGIIRSYSKIPIIVLSSLGHENTVMEAFQLGADDFITKPFKPAELSIRVKKLLKQSPTS